MQSLAVSSDAFYYKLGEDFYLTPGTQLQDQVSLFGFGADTGIDLPFEFDGRVPTNEVKRQLIESGALGEDEARHAAAGRRPAAGDRPGPAGGHAAAARRRLLDVRQRRLRSSTPQVVQAILEPETPDGEPGFADLTQAVVAVQIAPASTRQIPMPPEIRDPIQDGIRRNITGPGYNGRSTTAEELFRDYPADAIQVAGKTGTAQGRLSYPWNDSSAFAAYSVEPEPPVHRRVVPREGRLRLDRRGAGRQVHVPRPVGQAHASLDPVQVSETLDTSQTVAGAGPARRRHRLHGRATRRRSRPPD